MFLDSKVPFSGGVVDVPIRKPQCQNPFYAHVTKWLGVVLIRCRNWFGIFAGDMEESETLSKTSTASNTSNMDAASTSQRRRQKGRLGSGVSNHNDYHKQKLVFDRTDKMVIA